MLIRLFKYLKGYVKIRVEGYSPERFLNICNANGILLWGVEKDDKYYVMYMAAKDFKCIRPFVRKTGTKIILLEKHGLPFFLFRFRKRKMFFLGMLLSIIAVYGLSLFVWNIHIEGNVGQTKEELLEYLESMGVEHGVQKNKVSCENIEKNLRMEYPNMLWVSAEMRGTRIIIQIKENEDKDIVSKIEEKDKTPKSIVADVSGRVETMVVRQGTPRVEIGDEVHAGDVLVDGYYAIKNDVGEIIRYQGVPADGDIVIIQEEEYFDTFSKQYEEKHYTGNKKRGFRITLLDKTWQFLPKKPFQNYETVSEQKQIHVTENFYLPCSIELFTYLEYDTETKNYTKEELKELANIRFQNKYKNNLQKGVQIIEKDVKIDVNGNLCVVGGKVTLRVPVTAKVPAVIPEISAQVSGEGE